MFSKLCKKEYTLVTILKYKSRLEYFLCIYKVIQPSQSKYVLITMTYNILKGALATLRVIRDNLTFLLKSLTFFSKTEYKTFSLMRRIFSIDCELKHSCRAKDEPNSGNVRAIIY